MSRRASDLLQEMQGIFGGSFGHVDQRSLTESDEISEAPRNMPSRHAPSHKGLLHQNKKDLPVRGGKSGMTPKAKQVMKAKPDEKKAGDDSAFHDVMKDIRGQMDQSHKKSVEKKAKAGASPVASGGNRGHNPFSHARTIGQGPDHGDKRSATKCWHCSCGPIYTDGCNCTASGKGPKCPEAGTKKKIKYHADTHRAYNRRHHACTNAAGKKIDCGSSSSGKK